MHPGVWECQTQTCALLRLHPCGSARRLILSARQTSLTRRELLLSAMSLSWTEQGSGDGCQSGFYSSGENSFDKLLKLPATFRCSVGADRKCSAPMPKALPRPQQQKIRQVFSVVGRRTTETPIVEPPSRLTCRRLAQYLRQKSALS